jgi:hypothetical protein
MNDDSVLAAADAIARRVLAEDTDRSPSEIADSMSRLVFSGYSTPQLQLELVAFVQSAKDWSADGSAADQNLRAWSAACHALLASSRFQILE